MKNNYFRNFINLNRNISKPVLIIYIVLGLYIIGSIFNRLFLNPYMFIMVFALYFAIVPHEVAHGAAANIFGDPTAKLAGRLTLNPLKHIDIFGLLIPIILIFLGWPFVIGWAKPVPVNYRFIKNKKIGLFSVAIAGVATNFVIAFLFTLTLRILFDRETIVALIMSIFQKDFNWIGTNINYILGIFIIYVIFINVGLALFNLIPIPPLDGSRVIESFGNKQINNFFDKIEKYGFFIIIGFVYIGLIDFIIRPAFLFIIELLFLN